MGVILLALHFGLGHRWAKALKGRLSTPTSQATFITSSTTGITSKRARKGRHLRQLDRCPGRLLHSPREVRHLLHYLDHQRVGLRVPHAAELGELAQQLLARALALDPRLDGLDAGRPVHPHPGHEPVAEQLQRRDGVVLAISSTGAPSEPRRPKKEHLHRSPDGHPSVCSHQLGLLSSCHGISKTPTVCRRPGHGLLAARTAVTIGPIARHCLLTPLEKA